MWELSNFWGEGKSTQINSYLAVMHEIHVLLVDHDADGVLSTSKMLEMCQYKVTVFELASAAITMLSNGKVKVDLLMANINSPDLQGFKLLQLAVNMGIPIILMTIDDNSIMAMRAIESGAFLYMKKPAPIEALKCLWQHVVRAKMNVVRQRERLMVANYGVRGIEFREAICHSDDNPNNVVIMKDEEKLMKSYYNGRKDEGGYDSDVMRQGRVKRKVCTEWTRELHEKFMCAVEELGEGRCFPKEILELMNVPGLTRMQVASHLQKCRNDNWRSPEERKAANTTNLQSSDTEDNQHKPRRFGSMPRLGRGPLYRAQVSGGGEGSEAPPESEMANNGGAQNMGGPIMDNTIYQQQQQQQNYGAVVSHPITTGINSSNPSHSSADQDYFYFQNINSQIQNYSGMPQGSAGMGQPHSSLRGYNFDPVYGHVQNSNRPTMENRNQWASSETSNFRSDDSERRGH